LSPLRRSLGSNRWGSKWRSGSNPHIICHCSFITRSLPTTKTLSFSQNISPSTSIFFGFLNEMLEQKIKAPENRGFYVIMKLLPSKNGKSVP
ncbi:unnamed protein product, partial [Prunus brigantina]